MADLNTIRALLGDKGALLQALERESDALLTCETDDLEGHMQTRQQLIEQIERLDQEIDAAGAGPQQEDIAAVLRNRCERDGLPAELAGLYDAAQQNFARLHRVLAIDQQATARLEAERERLLETIREHNQGAEAQAAKFHAGLSSGRGDLLGGQKA